MLQDRAKQRCNFLGKISCNTDSDDNATQKAALQARFAWRRSRTDVAPVFDVAGVSTPWTAWRRSRTDVASRSFA